MADQLSHVMRIMYKGTLGEERSILYNELHVSEAEALRLVNAGEYSPYVLDIPSKQFEGLFLNMDVQAVSSPGIASEMPLSKDRFVENGPEKRATIRRNIKPGLLVDIVLKADQPTGKLTRGKVKDILTNSGEHYRGIKVRLADGQVGRVQAIIDAEGEKGL